MTAALALSVAPLDWTPVLLLAALAALLALDETAFAQTWFGQPLPAALLAGFICGDPETGLVVGLIVQVVELANLPVGQSFVGDGATAAIAAVGAAKQYGWMWLPPADATNYAGLVQLGWLVLGALLLSVGGNQVVLAERQAHLPWMLEGHRSLRDGSLNRMERLQLRCVTATLLRGFLLAVSYQLLLHVVWLPLAGSLPLSVLQAVALVPVLAVAVGLGSLIEHFGSRVCWRWLVAGLGSALAVGVVLL